MTFQAVIAQQSLSAGVHRSATRTLNNPAARITLRLVASWVETDDMGLFGVEWFDVAANKWRHVASAVTYGGARDRSGNMPSISLTNVPAGDYRVLVLLSQPTSLGLEIEIA